MSQDAVLTDVISILIVDDDPDIRDALRDALVHDGYRVHAVGFGTEAIELVRHGIYGAAVLDMHLPDLDGQVVLRSLMELDPSLPVIILTGHVTTENTVGSLTKGAFAYVTKPYNLEEVRATLRRAVGVKALAIKAESIESALSESEDRFRSVVQTATDAIVIADANGMVLSWNRAAQLLFGHAEEEIVGRPLTLLMPARYRLAHEQGLERMRTIGQSRVIGKTLELHGLRKDNTEFPLELSLGMWKAKGETFYSGILRDISERRRTEQRVAAQYAVSRVLAESQTLRQATPKILQTIGESVDWDVGVIWSVDRRDNLLRCVDLWASPQVNAPEFEAATRAFTFARGVGLPGRVWEKGEPKWILDVTSDPNFPLASIAADQGLHGAFAFPIIIGHEVAGVFEFFSRAIRTPDEDLLRMMAALGNQIGQFTERKQAEEALDRLNHQNKLILNSAGEGIYGLDLQGNTAFVNPAAARMLGWEVEDLLGQPMHPILHHTRHDGTPYPRGECPIYAVFQDGVVRHLDNDLFWRKDGSCFPVEYVSTPIREQEKLVGAVVVFKDITERKRNEERLAKINECFLSFGKDAIENIERLVALCGELLGGRYALYSHLEGTLLHAVGRWHTPPGYTPLGKPDGHICNDVIREGSSDALVLRNLPETPYAQSDPTVLPYKLQTYVGQTVRCHGASVGALCVLYQKDFVPSEGDRRLMGIIASAIGVEEERQQAEDALRHAYDETEKILAGLPCAIVIADQDQRVVYTNSLARQYFGSERASGIGRRVTEVLPLTVEQWHHLVVVGSAGIVPGSTASQDGEFEIGKRKYRYCCFPVALRGSERQQTGLVIWDITEQQQLQDQLIQVEKLASLGTLVFGMAHEINNPVQSIMGMAEILLEEDDPAKIKEYARDIVDSSTHVGTVVRNFAAYARLATREEEMEVDLNERISEAVKLVQRCPQFGCVEVMTELRPIPPLHARRAEVEQVFVNLISNAVEAMEGKGTLALSTRFNDQTVVAKIADTGPGIPKSAIGKIFDPFFTTKDPGKGTGLGLSIVHKIVTKYGGSIRVESEEDKGTTFIIHFPISTKEGHHGTVRI